MNTQGFNIGTVERDTGLSKDVLRMWERRYGFPIPDRDPHGERIYSPDQVARLHVIKRLMDLGHRPGKLLRATDSELQSLTPRHTSPPRIANGDPCDPLDALLALIRAHDAGGFVQAMQRSLARQGLFNFVQDTVAPLTCRVGEAWEAGTFEVFEEHLFTELTKRLLRQSIASLNIDQGSPRVMLTSLPDEEHMLGLLMVEAVLTLEGASCVPLGTRMPMLDIVRAAEAHQVDIVALSFSQAFPPRQIPGLLTQLRDLLPAGIALWAGGFAMRRVNPPPPGIVVPASFGALLECLADWRADQAARA